jgi:hypothetical protein
LLFQQLVQELFRRLSYSADAALVRLYPFEIEAIPGGDWIADRLLNFS